MLPFTKEKLTIAGQVRISSTTTKIHMSLALIPSLNKYFNLKQYLGIQEEINKRKKMALGINSEYDYANSQPIIVQKLYDKNKIQRIEVMYDSYVDFVLKFMQILYYEKFEDQYVYKYDENVFTAIEQTVDALINNTNYNFAEFQENLVQALDVDQEHMKQVEQKFFKTFKRFVKNSGVPHSQIALKKPFKSSNHLEISSNTKLIQNSLLRPTKINSWKSNTQWLRKKPEKKKLIWKSKL